MTWSVLPNLITWIRIFLLIPLTYLLLNDNYQPALIIFVVAGLSDAADGFLAKHFGWVSRFGAILDPLADKALLVITVAILAYKSHISWLFFSAVILRDIYIIGGAYYYHYRLGPYQMQPSYLSKLNTLVLLFLVACILLSQAYYKLPDGFIDAVIKLSYISIISSAIHYTWHWGRKLREGLKNKKDKRKSSVSKKAETKI
ncbi:MAG: CDP-alcohol phosphatidyltransferase family protein [Gammaproteobacteria bacterium]|nr:CDP-alcohol phosphatidyltransferase family protein [Gammaproteobacteria bacterium]MDH5630291.1 CDP-alcohol phosphatidyltransferase family protein [Gammaproteobacteria bacterium]